MHFTTILLSTTLLLYSIATVSAADAKTVFVAGYDGFVRIVSLRNDNGKYLLTETSKTDGCKTNPTWLTLDTEHDRLWCLDEGWVTGNGTLNSFDIEDGGVLTHTQRRNVSASPVQSTLFDSGRKLAIAQYGGPPNSTIRGGLGVHRIFSNGTLHCATNYTFDALVEAGPASGQDVPRGHGVVFDPTGEWLVVTDYGADKIRTFKVFENSTIAKGIEMETPSGSAPRHATFAKVANLTYLFVLSENANTITTYNVSYSGALMHLTTPSRVIDTFGGNGTAAVLRKAKAAEIQTSPDNKFLTVSNRIDESFPVGPAGGKSPRHFTINKAGDMVLVSATASSKIVVFKRDVATGKIGESVGSLEFDTVAAGGGKPAGIPAAIWYE